MYKNILAIILLLYAVFGEGLFDITDKPSPTPDIVGPHEDPDKCICKGSGVIVQGDGHKTVCPYHGSKFGKDVIIKPLIKPEE